MNFFCLVYEIVNKQLQKVNKCPIFTSPSQICFVSKLCMQFSVVTKLFSAIFANYDYKQTAQSTVQIGNSLFIFANKKIAIFNFI